MNDHKRNKLLSPWGIFLFLSLFIQIFYIFTLHTKMKGSKQIDIYFMPIVITDNI